MWEWLDTYTLVVSVQWRIFWKKRQLKKGPPSPVTNSMRGTMSSHYASWYCYEHFGMSLGLAHHFLWKRLTGHYFNLRIRGTFLSITPVTIVLAGVIQETQKGLRP